MKKDLGGIRLLLKFQILLMFEVCCVSARMDVFIHNSVQKKKRKSLIVEESHLTVFQGPKQNNGNKTELSGAPNKGENNENNDFFFSFLDLDVALMFTA